MSFKKMKESLESEGWFVAWGMPCCQSCAWANLPDDIDLSKVLFNHEQDCESDEFDECSVCHGEGWTYEEDYYFDENGIERTEEVEVDCEYCDGSGNHGPIYLKSSEATSSYFCFGGDEEGVRNLTAVLPLIKEAGCTVNWDGTGSQRPEISWSE